MSLQVNLSTGTAQHGLRQLRVRLLLSSDRQRRQQVMMTLMMTLMMMMTMTTMMMTRFGSIFNTDMSALTCTTSLDWTSAGGPGNYSMASISQSSSSSSQARPGARHHQQRGRLGSRVERQPFLHQQPVQQHRELGQF